MEEATKENHRRKKEKERKQVKTEDAISRDGWGAY